MNKNKKIKTIIILIIFIILLIAILIYAIGNVYGLFESNSKGVVKVGTGNWSVTLNNEDISSGTEKTFNIDSVNIEGSKYVKEGKIAPGMNGYFDINIKASADVAVRYDITFDTSKIDNQSINITSIKAITNEETLTKTGDNTYTKVCTLEEAKAGIESTIQAVVEWQNNEDYNEKDTYIGQTVDYKINIPVKVEVTQYLGEEIIAIDSNI